MNESLDDPMRRAAPHVDAGWADAFAVELRLRGVSGSDVGAALLEVESHMAERGGDVAAAFGDPRAYAVSLDLPDTAAWTPGQVVRLLGQLSLGIVAAVLLVTGLPAVVRDTGARVDVGMLGVILIAHLLVAGALVRWGGPILRAATERVLASAVVAVLGVVAVVAIAVLVPGPELTVTPAAALVGGALAAAACAGIAASQRRRGTTLDDPIVYPGG
jgi:hypothetical protein